MIELRSALPVKLPPARIAEWESRLAAILAMASRYPTPKRIVLCRDPADDAYLSLAGAVTADSLITGDDDLLALGTDTLSRAGLGHLHIVTPREFLDATRRPDPHRTSPPSPGGRTS